MRSDGAQDRWTCKNPETERSQNSRRFANLHFTVTKYHDRSDAGEDSLPGSHTFEAEEIGQRSRALQWHGKGSFPSSSPVSFSPDEFTGAHTNLGGNERYAGGAVYLLSLH